jgi:hypothetical protein
MVINMLREHMNVMLLSQVFHQSHRIPLSPTTHDRKLPVQHSNA